MSKQPRDDGNAAIPVLSYKRHGGQTLAFTAAAVRSTEFGGSTRVVSLFTNEGCFFEIGDSTIEANISNSHILPAGVYIDVSLGSEIVSTQNQKYISAIGLDGNEGTLYISERV
jgi:hypothetical protein